MLLLAGIRGEEVSLVWTWSSGGITIVWTYRSEVVNVASEKRSSFVPPKKNRKR